MHIQVALSFSSDDGYFIWGEFILKYEELSAQVREEKNYMCSAFNMQ